MSSVTPVYSVILPVYNERDNLELLLEEIRAALSSVGRPWEVIAVDDLSNDGSLELLHQLRSRFAGLRVVRHRVNSGQSAAFASGLRHARGPIVITLDADRQNDPAELPRMIAALTDGVDAVLGVRQRREDSALRRISSRLANRYRDWLTGVPVQDAGCFLRVLRREALAEVPVFNGLHRFLPTILKYQGYRFVELKVNHRPRVAGVSKYGIRNRLWRGIRDCFAMRWYRQRAIPGNRLESDAPLPEMVPLQEPSNCASK